MRFALYFMALFGMTASAAQIVPTSISASGTGIFNGSLSLITNNVIPSEGSVWTAPTNVYWTGSTQAFTIDLGAVYTIDDFLASLDNNDTYVFQGSLDNTAFANFVTVSSGIGNIGNGMDTFSSRASDGASIYVASLELTPFQARYVKVFATTGDNSNSIGEVQLFGSLYNPVPEPSTMGLLALGLSLGAVRLRWK